MSKVGRLVKDTKGRYLSIGKVISEEMLGGRSTYIVDFEEGIFRIPEEELEFIETPMDRLYSGEYDFLAFRLRVMATLMMNDNLRTGSLSSMKINPVPHQILMAKQASSTPAKGFLIADDVGLGKTIEAGLAMRMLMAQGRADSILIITPASLVPQWRDIMDFRFGEYFNEFSSRIRFRDVQDWNNTNRVIASIHTVRKKDNRDLMLERSEDWDLVIVDEAHHLTMKKDRGATENYKLLKKLRPRTGFFLFLTATPHQGDSKMFANLLRLLDPDYISSMEDLNDIGDRINEIIGRNRKSTVVDFDGKKLFKGHDIILHTTPPDQRYLMFLEELESFVNEGFVSLSEKSGERMAAENFLLTTLMKLASSSPSAIERALKKRKGMLKSSIKYDKKKGMKKPNLPQIGDERYRGEYEESYVAYSKEIFQGEIERIEHLLSMLQGVTDAKIHVLEGILSEERLDKGKEHLLIFTEYRATQDMIRKHLATRFGDKNVDVINGDMSAEEKRKVSKKFQGNGLRFLVSTEAGGEGIDLHGNCHIMVNYDLPWNPMRLHQRTGRLDRYGQKHRVKVHHIILKGTIDEKIQELLTKKLEHIEASFSHLKGDRLSDIKESVLGNLSISESELTRYYVQKKDISEVVEKKQVEDAIEIVKEQEEVFRKVVGVNPHRILEDLRPKYTLADLEKLISLYLTHEKKRRAVMGNVVEIPIPSKIKDMKRFYGRRLRYDRIKGTFDKRTSEERSGVELLGVENPYIGAMMFHMTRGEAFGDAAALRLFVDERSLIGRKLLLVIFSIVTVSTGSDGHTSLDGFEIFVKDISRDEVLEESLRDTLLEEILNESTHIVLLESLPIDRERLQEHVDEIENYIRSRPYARTIHNISITNISYIETMGAKDE